jgi:hypothetical protein
MAPKGKSKVVDPVEEAGGGEEQLPDEFDSLDPAKQPKAGRTVTIWMQKRSVRSNHGPPPPRTRSMATGWADPLRWAMMVC